MGLLQRIALALAIIAASALPLPALAADAQPGQIELDVRLGTQLRTAATLRGGVEERLSWREARLLNEVFDDLAYQAKRQYALPYSLHVLSSTSLADAWVYPDGSVYVTMGLIRMLPRESELAGLYAHLLAHAALRLNVRDVTSADGQALLRAVAEGRLTPTDDALGRYATALKGESSSADAEREADSLAAYLLYRAGYQRENIDELWSKLAADAPSAVVLRTHQHPSVNTWAAPVAPQPPAPQPVAPPAPPVTKTDVVIVAPPLPVPEPPHPGYRLPDHEERISSRRERHDRFGFGVAFGTYPLDFLDKNVLLSVTDQLDETYVLALTQRPLKSVPVATISADMTTSSGLVLSVEGGGGLGDQLFSEGGHTQVGFISGGVGVILANSPAFRASFGGFLEAAYLSTPVGFAGDQWVPTGGDSSVPDYMKVHGNYIYKDTMISAEATTFGAGLQAKASGSLGGGPLEWYANAKYRMLDSGSFSFTAPDDWTWEETTIPYTGGPWPDSLQPKGLSLDLGVRVHF